MTQDNGNQMTTEYSATGTAVGRSIVGVRTARLSHQTTTRGFWRITGEYGCMAWDAHEIVVIPAAGSLHAAGDDVTAISYSPYS